MANIQYIGARYVAKFYENPDDNSNNWKSGITYEPLTIVTYNSDTYISKKRVPVSIGNPADNSSYWVLTGYYNGQIMILQNAISTINAKIGSGEFDTESQIITGAINELKAAIDFTKQYYVSPEMYGAKGDGVTNDHDAIQNAIDDGKTTGKPVILKGVTYRITSSLNVYSGSYIKGATNPQMYQGSYGKTTILADFGNNNQYPIINASDNALIDYGYTLPGNRYEEITIENLYLRGDAFCGIKAKCYNSKFNNISIDECKVGLHLLSCYCTYFERVCATKCEIGAYCHGTNANANMRNCWFNYGLGILNDDDLSTIILQTLPAIETTKKAGIVLNYANITLLQCNLEAYYYGAFLFGLSILKADGLNIEQIVTGGAAIADSATTAANQAYVRNLTLWNSNDFGGSVAKCSYRGKFILKSSQRKPSSFADPILSNRCVFALEYTDEIYTFAISISHITNANIIHNNTHFNDQGKLIIDFTLWDYDSQDPSQAPILSIGNLSGGFVTGLYDFSGTNFILNEEYMSIVRRVDSAFDALNKRARYYAEIEFN